MGAQGIVCWGLGHEAELSKNKRTISTKRNPELWGHFYVHGADDLAMRLTPTGARGSAVAGMASRCTSSRASFDC